jgi:hypothetical protein
MCFGAVGCGELSLCISVLGVVGFEDDECNVCFAVSEILSPDWCLSVARVDFEDVRWGMCTDRRASLPTFKTLRTALRYLGSDD